MKSILAITVVGLLLFGVSAGVSWMVVFNEPETPEEVLDDDFVDGAESFPSVIDVADQASEMPVALRPDKPITVEVVTELAHSIMKKDRAIKDAEKRLKKEEKRIMLLFEDLVREREELTAFGESIDAKVRQAREAVELLKVENELLTQQKNFVSKIERKNGKTIVDAKSDELDARVDEISGWFKGLEPEAAASQLKEFANRGDLDFAARLLGSLGERDSTKVLAVFDDAPLMADMIEAYVAGKSAAQASGKTKLR